jgi:hypothetical protein
MRTKIGRLLRRYRYPPGPDGTHDGAVETVLKQAEQLGDDLTGK